MEYLYFRNTRRKRKTRAMIHLIMIMRIHFYWRAFMGKPIRRDMIRVITAGII
jgi:hypothetical protein